MRGWKVWTEPSGNGWRCRWRGTYGAGQQWLLYKNDALAYAEAKKRGFTRADAGLEPLPAPVVQNFPIFRREYEAWLHANRSARTLYLAKNSLDMWVEYAGEKFPVTRKIKAEAGGFTPDDFCSFIMNAREKRTSVNYARMTLRHLKAAFRWGQKHEYIDRDPFLHFEMPPAVKVARVLRPEELAAILQHLPEVCARAAVFVVYTGLRIGEVLNMDWSGVEEVNGTHYLTVLKSKTRRAVAETKTQAIHPIALKAMGPRRESGRVFDVKLSRLSQTMAAAARKVGLGRVRWHDLRHTWATHLGEEARDMKALMDAGGWATVQAAMIYQHSTAKRRDVTLQMPYSVPAWPLKIIPVEIKKSKKT